MFYLIMHFLTNRTFKRDLSVFLLLINLFYITNLFSQDTYLYWESSEQDETIQCAFSYEPNRIFANVMVGEYSTNYEDLFLNYHNKLLKLDYKLEVL